MLIYGISRAVNAHAEFRMSVGEDGVPGMHDVVHPGYTVFHPQDETFSALWTQYDASFPVFYRRYLEDVAAYGSTPVPAPKPACPEGTFDISCIPWSHFTSFNLNLKNGDRYLSPIFTMGKYEQSGGKVLLPLALQVHHAVCDGFHAARLLREVEEWAQAFVPQGV